jgi:hypothetical protein
MTRFMSGLINTHAHVDVETVNALIAQSKTKQNNLLSH